MCSLYIKKACEEHSVLRSSGPGQRGPQAPPQRSYARGACGMCSQLDDENPYYDTNLPFWMGSTTPSKEIPKNDLQTSAFVAKQPLSWQMGSQGGVGRHRGRSHPPASVHFGLMMPTNRAASILVKEQTQVWFSMPVLSPQNACLLANFMIVAETRRLWLGRCNMLNCVLGMFAQDRTK